MLFRNDEHYYKRLVEEFKSYQHQDISGSCLGYRLWFSRCMVEPVWRMSLSNLKHFTDHRQCYRLEEPNFDILYQLLSLPQIQTIHIEKCRSVPSMLGLRSDNGGPRSITKCPSLRRLELFNDHLQDQDLELVAQATSSLEHLIIVSKHHPAIHCKKIGNLFLTRNKGRLTERGIYIGNIMHLKWGSSRRISRT
ncbi:hypothetical protein ABW21_db0202595 [Orbilia brochopaga]|nr:hypothetical protein ABW21_db0202595 [Drechslerella brochopaga]